MARADDRCSLLAGVLAVRHGFVRPEGLEATVRGGESLGEGDRRALQDLLTQTLADHGGDVEACLQELQSEGTFHANLEPSALAAPEASLASLGRQLTETAETDGTVKQPGDNPEAQATVNPAAPQTLVGFEPDWRTWHAPPQEDGPDHTRLVPDDDDGRPGPPPGAAGRPVVPGSSQRFQILRLHARGGLGEVYVAEDQELRREVALKEIHARDAFHPEVRSRFVLEAEVTGNLEHPGVVPVYGLGRYPDGRPYYAMRFVRGESLRSAIARFHGGPADHDGLEIRQLLRRFVDVCNTIAYAHSRKVLHRDIKPDNVMLGAFGETLVVDWGLAKRLDRPEEAASWGASASGLSAPAGASGQASTLPGSTMGTPQYMSPEQAAGRHEAVGPASDVYSLGSTLYCILTGHAPYEARTVAQVIEKVTRNEFPRPRERTSGVPPALEAVCLKAMALRPEDRYPTAQALGEDVDRWVAHEPVSAWREPWPARVVRWSRRHSAWVQAGGAALAVVTAAAVAAGVLVASARERELRNYRAAEQQRRVAEGLRERRRRELSALRAAVEDLTLRARQDLDSGHPRDARLHAAEAVAASRGERELDELRARAERLVAESDRGVAEESAGQAARDAFARFRQLHDDALFHGTLLTGLDQDASREATRRAAGEALALHGIDAEAPAGSLKPDAHLTDAERDEVTSGCYELLLVAAQAAAQATPATAPEAARAGLVKALKLLDLAGQVGPPTRAYHQRRSAYLTALGESAAARAEADRAAAVRPTRAVDFFLLGEQAYQQGRPEQAAPEFESALRAEPGHFWAQYFLAACHLKGGRPAEAKAGLTACLARRPAFVWALILRGYAHGERREYDAAEGDFRAALALEPDDLAVYGVHVNRGGMRLRQGRLDDATADLRRAVALRPNQYQAYTNLGAALEAREQWAEARAQYDRAVTLAPEVASAYRGRARVSERLGQLPAALHDYEEALRHEPDGGPEAAGDDRERGRLLQRLDRHEEALAAYERAARGLPNDRALQRLRADALVALNRGPEALAALDASLDDARDAVALRQRAFERAKADDHAGALADYTRALALEPDAPAARARRGWSYLIETPKLALRDFEAAIARDPRDGDLYNGRGYARALLGRHKEAAADAEEALRLGPGSPDPRARLALTYNAACVYAQASARVPAAPPGRAQADPAPGYRDRAARLLRQTLELLPPDARAGFLQQAREDPALVPVLDRPPLADAPTPAP